MLEQSEGNTLFPEETEEKEKLCPVCKIAYSPEAEYCAVCKAKLIDMPKKQAETTLTPEQEEQRKKDWKVLGIGFLLLIGVLYGGYSLLKLLIQ